MTPRDRVRVLDNRRFAEMVFDMAAVVVLILALDWLLP